MSRSHFSLVVVATVAVVILSGAFVAYAADEPTTAASATTRPVARPLPELFRLDLRERKLDVSIVPPREGGGGGEDVETTTRPSFEFTAAGDERWQILAWPRERRRDGSYAVFSVSCDSREDDHWSSLQLVSVESDDQALTVTGNGRMGRGFVLVTYRQDAKLRDVRFTVQRPRRLRPRPLHEFAAQDLDQLFIDHQVEVRQYLIPLLKEVCGVNPLRPRAGDVYRAFATIPADPVAVEKLRAVLVDLDAASPPVRNAASAKLKSLGAGGVLAALRIDRTDLTPEQSARLDAFVDQNSIWPDPVAAAHNDPRFLADCLAHDDLAVRSAALTSLRAMMRNDVSFDVNAAPASRERAVAEIIEGLDSLDKAIDPLPADGDAPAEAQPAGARPAAAAASDGTSRGAK